MAGTMGRAFWVICICAIFTLLCITTGSGCSDYLVSGPNIIANDKITASSYLAHHFPYLARLHSTTTNPWCSQSNEHKNTSDFQDHYIQVEFKSISAVVAIVTQSRYNLDQWVSSYYVQYSNDGSVWNTIKDSSNEPKLYTGNSDRNTVKKNYLPANLKTMHIRIIPDTWNGYLCMRFDVIGCPILPTEQVSFYGEFVPMKVDEKFQKIQVFERANITTLPDCVAQCDKSQNCMSFAFDQVSAQCHGYSSQKFANELMLENGTQLSLGVLNNVFYYFDRSITDMHGFTVDRLNGLCYKVYTTYKTQTDAENFCIAKKAHLLPLRTTTQLNTLKTLIGGSWILNRETGILIDGKFIANKWVTHDGDEIPEAFWETGKKDKALGECVTLTSRGLSATQCSESKFFICGF